MAYVFKRYGGRLSAELPLDDLEFDRALLPALRATLASVITRKQHYGDCSMRYDTHKRRVVLYLPTHAIAFAPDDLRGARLPKLATAPNRSTPVGKRARSLRYRLGGKTWHTLRELKLADALASDTSRNFTRSFSEIVSDDLFPYLWHINRHIDGVSPRVTFCDLRELYACLCGERPSASIICGNATGWRDWREASWDGAALTCEPYDFIIEIPADHLVGLLGQINDLLSMGYATD